MNIVYVYELWVVILFLCKYALYVWSDWNNIYKKVIEFLIYQINQAV